MRWFEQFQLCIITLESAPPPIDSLSLSQKHHLFYQSVSRLSFVPDCIKLDRQLPLIGIFQFFFYFLDQNKDDAEREI